MAWGEANRRDFYWRSRPLLPFEMLVVEVLLARTRAESVPPVARSLLERYPTPGELARASLQDVESILRPLGLYRKRARSLIELARVLEERYSGSVPERLEELLDLPYVGRYAASAFLCFHHGKRLPVVDANIVRVFRRCFGLTAPTGKTEAAEDYWALARSLVPTKAPALFNWTLLDLGAVVCTPRKPKCEECPLRRGCRAARGRGGRLRHGNRSSVSASDWEDAREAT